MIAQAQLPGPVRSQSRDCSATLAQWEQLVQDLKRALSDYEEMERTPVKRIIDGPLVDTGASGTIASQVARALSVKEDMLTEQRNLCRNIIKMEEDIFASLQACEKGALDRKEKRALKKLTRKRNRLIKKTRLQIAEVREVRGKEMDYSYAEYWNNQQRMRPGQNQQGYWNQYQRMYQSWWGR
jgi:hypothetical protein